jgi:excisionase family DNA binding protein
MRRDGHTAGTGEPKSRIGIGPLGAAEDCQSCRLLSLKDAAAYLGLSYWTLRDLVNAGTLRAVKLPLGAGRDLRRILLDRRDLDALVERSK